MLSVIRPGVLMSLLALAACSISGSKHAMDSVDVLSRRNDHVQMADLVYRPLALGETVDIEVTATDPVLLLDKYETVYAKGFALPPWTAPYMLKISSYIIGSPQDPAVYYPTVLFLDAQYREVRRSHLSSFTFRRGAGFSDDSNLNGTIFINQANREEVYAVLVSQRQAAHGSMVMNNIAVQQAAIIVPVGAGSLTWMVPTGAKESTAATAASATGKLRVIVEAYRPAETGAKAQ